MTMDIAALRALRKNSASTLTKITKALEKEESSGSRKDDDRFWKATVDKAGNGTAVIRFLPAIGDGMPWAKVYDHGFQGPSGKWYIEKCLTTIGQEDPVVEHCNGLWATGLESDKELARKRKRRLAYYANVLIVNDPADPSNNGQVKLFKFGKKIFDKLKDKLQPTFADETAVDIFDPFNGCNFRLRIAKVDGYSNTDKSVFDAPSELGGGDEEEMIRILNARHNLDEFTDPKNFKSYDELKKKLDQVLNTSSASMDRANDFLINDKDEQREAPAPSPKATREAPAPRTTPVSDGVDFDDMSFFENLASD